jgi:hypothetical protein
MTINSLNANQSTVVSGLGTQTFNVVTTGLYTLSFQSFIPYLASGGQPQSTVPAYNADNVATVADSAGSLNSTFWKFYSAGDLQGFYVWYNINSAGVDPAPAGLTGIAVTGATNASANTLATATRTAIAANAAAASYVAVSGATNHVILTQKNQGSCTVAVDGSAATGFSFSNSTAGTYGVPAQSGLDVVIKQGSTVLARYGFPTPTQPLMSGSVLIQATAADVLTVVLSSLSTADNAANAVKTIINLFQGE